MVLGLAIEGARKSKEDSRVHHRGLVPTEEALNTEMKADLLNNQLPTEGAFTRFLFPSTILEFIILGTPALSTRLPGIPDIHDEDPFGIDDDSWDGLRRAIISARELVTGHTREGWRC